MTMDAGNLLTISDVAERLKVERHKASDLMKLMPCFVLPGSRTKRVRETDFEDWIAAHTVMPGAAPTKRREAKKAQPEFDPRYFEPDGRIKRRRKGG